MPYFVWTLERHYSLHLIVEFKAIFLFVHHLFSEKGKFLKVFNFPHLEDNRVKTVDEWGRNIMCKRTLPSLFVSKRIYLFFKNTKI